MENAALQHRDQRGPMGHPRPERADRTEEPDRGAWPELTNLRRKIELPPPPPRLLRLASWLSYAAALALIAVGYETTANGFLLAAPWFLLGLGLMSGAPSGWRGAWAAAGFYGILAGAIVAGLLPASPDALWEAVIGLGFLALFAGCLAAPTSRGYIREVKVSQLRPHW